MPWRGPHPDEPLEVPSLGPLIGAWIERHCVVADGDYRAQVYGLTNEMWAFLGHYYRVREDASADTPMDAKGAWVYRRGQLVRPQKWGKGPFSAAIVCAEAVGPAFFAGWAEPGDAYRCADHGCDCGWVWQYEPGDPMGRPWATPLIQITAASEDQTDNVWRQLVPMIELGPLAAVIPDTGETRINLPGGGKIEPVTSKARSRLGAPVTFVVQDEPGTWTESNGGQNLADTQRRGLAGMGGRAIETTNAWNPAELSVAQRTYESSAKDIFRDFRQAPKSLSFKDKKDRRKIYRYVYGESWWVNFDIIDSMALELMERDPQQAERFFGNRVVYGLGTWLPEGRWDDSKGPTAAPPLGTAVCAGFDGSENNDWSAIRLETLDGFQFTPTYGPDTRPTVWNPAEWPNHEVPRTEVRAAWDELMHRYKIRRAYCDPLGWRTEIQELALAYGEKVVLEWATNRPAQMHASLLRFETDLATGIVTHDHCKLTETHVANARKLARPGQRYILGKPTEHQKIDAAMSSVLAHEARCDAVADGPPKTGRARGKTRGY